MFRSFSSCEGGVRVKDKRLLSIKGTQAVLDSRGMGGDSEGEREIEGEQHTPWQPYLLLVLLNPGLRVGQEFSTALHLQKRTVWNVATGCQSLSHLPLQPPQHTQLPSNLCPLQGQGVG